MLQTPMLKGWIVLDFVSRSLHPRCRGSVISKPLEQPEHELTLIVDVIHRAADSIDHHVEVIEGLATSVEPLKDSVNNLNATMIELVALMAPMASAEHACRTSSMAFTMSSTGRTAWSGSSAFVDTRRRSTRRPSRWSRRRS